jgi:rubrerythrin
MQSEDLAHILREALLDERKAQASYAAVIERFGPVRPFINILEAERRHAAALERQMERLGIEVPPDLWPRTEAAPSSLEAACEAAIAAEIENIALYDRLIPSIADAAVKQVLEALQAASRDRHLPAFRRRLARQRGEAGAGHGGRWGGGRGRRGV